MRISGRGLKTKYPELNKHMNKWWAEHKVQNKERVTHFRLQQEVQRFAKHNEFPPTFNVAQWTTNYVVRENKVLAAEKRVSSKPMSVLLEEAQKFHTFCRSMPPTCFAFM